MPGSPLGSPDNPLRVAIIGSGPSGFYAAERLLNAEDLSVQVDISTACRRPSASCAAAWRPTTRRSSR